MCIFPDAVFPNNWLSLHQSGHLVLYPMATANRRTERRREIVQHFVTNYQVTDVVDLTKHETRDIYLEGTGSVVFDHKNRH